MDVASLVALDYHSYKSNLDLVAQTSQGINPAQFNLNLERLQPAIPILSPLVAAMVEGQRKLAVWSALPAEKRNTPGQMRQVVRDVETVARLQGAIGALFAVGDILLNTSMKEQMTLQKEEPKPTKKKAWKPKFEQKPSKPQKKSTRK